MEMHLHIISKKKAKELGMKWYFTGKPCAKGHVAQRNMWTECYLCKSAKNKKWKENNREDHERYQREYQRENADYFRRQSDRWWRSHRKHVYARNLKRKEKKRLRTLDFENRINRLINKQREIELRQMAKQYEEWLGIKFEVDHIVPLLGKKVSGLHWYGNLQLLPMTFNRRKRESFWQEAA